MRIARRQRLRQRADAQARLEIGEIGQSGTNAPSTNTMRRASIEASSRAGVARARLRRRVRRARQAAWHRASARAGRCISTPRPAGAAGPRASKRCERRLAQRRQRAGAARQRSPPLRVASKLLPSSAAARPPVRSIWAATSAFMRRPSRHLFLILRVALGLELERQLLAAGAHDAALATARARRRARCSRAAADSG